MSKTMMWLGPVRFSINTAAYEKLQRTTHYQWGKQQPLGHPVLKYLGLDGPSYQYIRPGDDSITLDGVIYPNFNGGLLETSLMRLAANIGIPLPLIQGSGFVLGTWIIESVTETSSVFFSDGSPRKIDFSLSLQRYNSADLSSILGGIGLAQTAIDAITG